MTPTKLVAYRIGKAIDHHKCLGFITLTNANIKCLYNGSLARLHAPNFRDEEILHTRSFTGGTSIGNLLNKVVGLLLTP